MLHALLTAALAAPAQPPAEDWKAAESAHLKNIRQVTFDFVRAGEGYFSPDGRRIIYQAEEKGTGNPFYQIFVQDLATGRARRVSPGAGKTTCAYFRPDGKKIIFASSHLDPDAKSHYGPELAQRAEEKRQGVRRRYQWDFDPYMDIFEANPDGTELKRLTDAKGYDAEGSYSPDGKRVVFRSDRKEKDRLQLYVINADGTGERALTDRPSWVCWGPFWHPDGRHVAYAGADHGGAGRPNYDLYWLDVETGKETRLTYAPGADVLPAFNRDGTKLMWTSTRDGRQPSQIYVADFTPPKE